MLTIQFNAVSIMATPKIKLFLSVQKYFKAMGYYAPSQPEQICEFNRINGFYIFSVGGMLIPVLGFLFFKAESAYEYVNSFYIAITIIGMIFHFTAFLFNVGTVLNLIQKYQELTKKRK